MPSNPVDSNLKTAKHHKWTRLAAFVVVFLVLAGILMFAIISSSKSHWHCIPSQPRPSGIKAWEAATNPARTAVESNEDFFAGFTIRSDQNNLFVEHPTKNLPDNPFDYEIKIMTPGEPLNIGGGTLRLCAIGTAYLDATQTMEDDALYHFYDTDLRNITEEQVKEFGSYNVNKQGRDFRHSPFPRAQFALKNEGIEDLMFHSIKIFDASTRKELAGGNSSISTQAYHWFSADIPLWHHTPVDIVLEISHGPPKTFEFAPRVGEGFRDGNFECRLVCVIDDGDIYSSGSSSGKNITTIEFLRLPKASSVLQFFFACQPTAGKMPITFEFLDAEGKMLSGLSSYTFGLVHHHYLNQPLEKVARIRARYHRQRQRILIHLPYIPGLPEHNNTIENLFDIHIPYVRLHTSSEVGDFLRQTLQLKMFGQIAPIPPDSINYIRFPVEFCDATVREIAQFFAKPGDLKIDIQNEQLLVEYPVPLRTRLKQFLQSMFRRKRP